MIRCATFRYLSTCGSETSPHEKCGSFKRKEKERKEKKKRKRYPCMSTYFSSPNSKKATALTEEPITVYSKSNMKINTGVCLSLCTSHVIYHRPTSNWPITCSFCLTHRPSVSSSWLTDWLDRSIKQLLVWSSDGKTVCYLWLNDQLLTSSHEL